MYTHFKINLRSLLNYTKNSLKFFLCQVRHLLFSSFTVECVSWYWVGRSVEKKKKPKKKSHKKSRNSRPWYPRTTLKVNIHIFRLTKCTIYCEKCSCLCFCFLYAVTMLIFHIKRIILSEKWCNYVVFFF